MKPGYKQTDVGVIPEVWDVKEFGELYAEPSRNGVYKSAEFQGRGTRIVNMGEMFGFDFISDQEMSRVSLTAKEIATSELRDGDLLFGRRSVVPSGAGKCSLVVKPHEPLIFESSIIRVRLNQTQSNPLFQYFFFASSTGRSVMSFIISGTNVKGIRGSELRGLKIPHPPLPEQHSIAEALSDVDALLGALDRLITKKRNLKKAAMQHLLTAPSSGGVRLSGFHGEWELKALGDLFNFSGGYSASRDQLSDEGHCYLHYGDIHGTMKTVVDVRADYQNIPKLDIPLKQVASKSMLEDGDVVFVDASEDDEGTSRHIVVVNKEGKPFISGLHTIVAKSKTDELALEYRRYCFQTAAMRQQFLFYAVGTKVTGISKRNIAKLTIPVPKVPEQIAIAEVLSAMDADLTALEQRREKTRNLKQAMMQELLTGRTRLVVKPKPAHNWQINEAVIIGALTLQFGTEEWPLPRKRRVKLTYLFHRHAEGKAEGFLKKAAGPYNPKTKYQGPEAIALKNGYVREHNNGKYVGFVSGEKIAQAEQYFTEWYPGANEWLEQFRFEKTDELELLATVDMAMEDLHSRGRGVAFKAVKGVICSHTEWEAKLSRPIFSDINIKRAIDVCSNLFAS